MSTTLHLDCLAMLMHYHYRHLNGANSQSKHKSQCYNKDKTCYMQFARVGGRVIMSYVLQYFKNCIFDSFLNCGGRKFRCSSNIRLFSGKNLLAVVSSPILHLLFIKVWYLDYILNVSIVPKFERAKVWTGKAVPKFKLRHYSRLMFLMVLPMNASNSTLPVFCGGFKCCYLIGKWRQTFIITKFKKLVFSQDSQDYKFAL